MKTPLQARAERAAELFTTTARNPIVIEFAGVPKAGKTTTLNQLQTFLKRCGFRVEIVIERASVCPIKDKKHSNFNVWTACTTLSQILEKTQDPPRMDDPHILLLDRGLFDSICWLTMMEHLARIRKIDREQIERFLLIDDWRKRITAVILMTATPDDSMSREKSILPVKESKGSIMNHAVLKQILEVANKTAARLNKFFNIYTINTSNGDTRNQQKTAEIVTEIVIGLIENHIQEDILYLPKSDALAYFENKGCIKSPNASKLINHFLEKGTYSPRTEVESNSDLLQAIPIVVVRNKSGDILRLRRKENTEENILHKKMVIWAGGHVRKEDASNGNSILRCVLRELQEELRLSIEVSQLNLLGAIYVDVGERTSKHIAIVYEWTAATDDVSVALSNSEFYERVGTSLSGSFINMDNLLKEIYKVKNKDDQEIWSLKIITELLSDSTYEYTPNLI